jgi:hypothetical protein
MKNQNMKNKTLNEEMSRIKDMMKKIINEDFETQPEESLVDEELKQRALSVLIKFGNGEVDYDILDINLYECSFVINHGDSFDLTYTFQVNINQLPQYDSGVDRYSNGDPGYPSYYESMDWDVSDVSLKIEEFPDYSGEMKWNTLYEGEDFTNFLDYKFDNGLTGREWIKTKFNDELNNLAEKKDED